MGQFRATSTVASIILLTVAITLTASIQRASGSGAVIHVLGLNCGANPEVVTLRNSGQVAQDLSGWLLHSDPVTDGNQVFDLEAVGNLGAGQQVQISAEAMHR